MGEEILSFGDIQIAKNKFFCQKSSVFFKYFFWLEEL